MRQRQFGPRAHWGILLFKRSGLLQASMMAVWVSKPPPSLLSVVAAVYLISFAINDGAMAAEAHGTASITTEDRRMLR